MIEATSKKIENVENHQCGMEGLGAAVIELAVEDLKKQTYHTKSAIYFFKNAPKLLEFWLSAATYQGRKQLDINVAKQRLCEMACDAEQNILLSYQKGFNTPQRLKQKSARQR